MTRRKETDPLVITVAEAMKARRAELINEPLARLWEELAETAINTMLSIGKSRFRKRNDARHDW